MGRGLVRWGPTLPYAPLPVLPLDLVPGALFAFSFRKLRASYTGACIRVRNSLNAESDIGFTAAGDFDTVAYNTFVNLGDGTGHVVIWYDQSLSPLRLTQFTPANQPTVNLTASGGHPGVKFTAAGSQLLNTSSFLTPDTRPSTATVFCVGSYDGTQSDNATGVLFSASSGTVTRMQLFKRSTNLWALFQGNTTVPTVEADNTTMNLFTAAFSGATASGSSLRVNGRNALFATLASGTLIDLRLGADSTPVYSNATVCEIIGYPSLLASKDVVAVETPTAAYWHLAYSKPVSYATITDTTLYNMEASVVTLPSGVKVMAYTKAPNAGTSNFTLGATLNIRFSNNHGATWTNENTYLDGTAVTGFPMAPPGPTGNQGAGEPFLMVAPNGDILMHTWLSDYAANNSGSWQARCTDGLGKVWGAMAQITFANFPGGYTHVNNSIFSTDDYFVVGTDIYAGARILQANDAASTGVVKNIFITSPDNGVTWNYLSDVSSYTSAVGGANGTIEQAFAYLGGTTIRAILRGQIGDTHAYSTVSTDMGATWGGGTQTAPGALTDIVGQTLHVGRPRIKSFARLLGQANWWTDQRLIMCGYAGTDSSRRPCIWLSYDGGANWSHPMWLDLPIAGNTQGYGDMFYDPVLGELVVLTTMYVSGNSTRIINQYKVIVPSLVAA